MKLRGKKYQRLTDTSFPEMSVSLRRKSGGRRSGRRLSSMADLFTQPSTVNNGRTVSGSTAHLLHLRGLVTFCCGKSHCFSAFTYDTDFLLGTGLFKFNLN